MVRGLLCFMLWCSAFCGKAQTITTVAGNGLSGYNGDSILATDAKLSQPGGMSFDRNGNLYITDAFNHRYRRVDRNGIIQTVAGNGDVGYNGENILATTAEFNGFSLIISDKFNNLYIPDGNNHRVRRIDAQTGIITTIAGNGLPAFSGDNGLATQASLYYPGHLAFDKFGNLYISDVGNRRVRKIDTLGIITTIAGNGVMGFSGDSGLAIFSEMNAPEGLLCDSIGNVYVADRDNYRIRKIDINTGIITTIAGYGSYSFNGEGVLATEAGITPQSLAFDMAGNLCFSDPGNNRIRKIDSTGYIYTIAGKGPSGFGGDGGPADSALFYQPWDIAFDSCGNLYIGDDQNERIRKVTYVECDYLHTTQSQSFNPIVSCIFPNPATTIITITEPFLIRNLSIFNIVGRQQYYQNYNTTKVEVNISALPKGLYLIKVNEQYVQKLLKE